MTPAPSPHTQSASPTKRKAPRRSHRKSPPKEIHVVNPPGSAVAKALQSKAIHNNNNNDTFAVHLKTSTPVATAVERGTRWFRPVQLFSGSSWLSGQQSIDVTVEQQQPPPPQSTPPRPTELLSFTVTGPDQAGKRALVHGFCGASAQTQTTAAAEPVSGWSVEYHKKDWAYHTRGSAASATTASTTATTVQDELTNPNIQCVRLQLWNVSHVSDDNTTATTSVPEKSTEWPSALQAHGKHMVLVVSMDAGIQSARKTVRAWKKWLDNQAGAAQTMHVVVSVPAADNTTAHHSPSFHMRMGMALEQLSNELNIPSPFFLQQGQDGDLVDIYATWVALTEQVLSWKRRGVPKPVAAATKATVTASATAATGGRSTSTPGARKVDQSFSPTGTILVNAQDVIPITPHD